MTVGWTAGAHQARGDRSAGTNGRLGSDSGGVAFPHQVGPIPGGPYADVTFDTSESKLKALHPEVLCKQMPNPEVRMCRSKGGEDQEVTFLFYSGKLINIDGKTAD